MEIVLGEDENLTERFRERMDELQPARGLHCNQCFPDSTA